MKIAIWGAGPAGMLVAHAAKRAGHDFLMYSNHGPSKLYGAQYLHSEIPGVMAEGRMLEHQFRGTIEGYRTKVYDATEVTSVSPEQFTGHQMAWNIREAYEALMLKYYNRVMCMDINRNDLMGLGGGWPMHRWNAEFDMVVSTIPRDRLCVNPDHKFTSAKIFALGEAPELGMYSPIQPDSDMMLICSGDAADSWYRLSRIFGRTTVEWPGLRKKPPIKGVVEVNKPVDTTCDCWPEVHRMGRFGEWKKGVLTHHAFEQATALFSS